MILCLTAFIAILGHMQPMSLGLDTPAWINFAWKKSAFGFSSICFPPDFPFPFPYVLTNCLKGKTFLPLLLRSITVGEVTFLCAIVRAWEVVGDMERDWQKFLFIGWEIAWIALQSHIFNPEYFEGEHNVLIRITRLEAP